MGCKVQFKNGKEAQEQESFQHVLSACHSQLCQRFLITLRDCLDEDGVSLLLSSAGQGWSFLVWSGLVWSELFCAIVGVVRSELFWAIVG